MIKSHRHLGILATLALLTVCVLPSPVAAAATPESRPRVPATGLAARMAATSASSGFSARAVVLDPGSVELRGTLVVRVGDDFAAGTSTLSYVLESADGPTLLIVSGALDPRLGGAAVRVRGHLLEDGSVAVNAAAFTVEWPASSNPDAAAYGVVPADAPLTQPNAATQTRKVAVIVADFTNLTGYPVTTTQANQAFTGGTDSVQSYFETASRGRVTTTTTVLGPWHLGIAQCPYDFDRYLNAATSQATAHGVSLTSYDHIILWTKSNPCGDPSWGRGDISGKRIHLAVDSNTIPSDQPAVWAFTAAHEMDHNLGLAHSEGLRCTDGDGTNIPLGVQANCFKLDYNDIYSTMGFSGVSDHALLDAERLRSLGWLDSGEYQTITSVGTYHLVPTYSSSAGLRLIRIVRPATVTTGATSGGWTLELRSTLSGVAWDQFSSPTFAPVTTGVTVRYSEMPTYGRYAYSYLVDSIPDDGDYYNAPFLPGSTLTDGAGGFTVHIDSVDGTGATVTIGDTEAPSVPASLQAAALPAGGAELDWQAAADNLGLAHYRIYRDGTQIGEVSGTTLTYTDPPAGFGGTHTYWVAAVDTAGNEGTHASASADLAPPPTKPLNVHAVAGNSAAQVSWDPPATGSPISAYDVVSNPGEFHCATAGAASCVVDGLTNSLAYTFTVTATNTVGTGPVSDPSNSVTPYGVPGRPTGAAGTSGKGQVAVTWTAPSSPGDSAISGYTATAHPGGLTCSTAATIGCAVTGLTNGQAYTFTVTAANDQGQGLASDPSDPVTPASTPDAPVNVSAVGRNVSALVSWSAPPFDGGSPVTGYDVISTPGGETCHTSGALSCVVGGLTNRVSYRFVVTASNAVGPSDPSGLSTVAMPARGATYIPVTPNRLVDSRYHVGVNASLLSKSPVAFQITGRSSDPALNIPSGALAVTGNLTTVNSKSGGYLSLTPTDPGSVPPTSTLNFPAGDIRANSITAPLGPDGKMWVTFVGSSGKRSDVIFDVTGYFVGDTGGATYEPVTPNRILDSRYAPDTSKRLLSKKSVSFQVTGKSADPTMNVPAGAVAVVGNLTAVNQHSGGYFSLSPDKPAGVPPTSTINFPAGDIRANSLTVPLGAGGVLWVTFVGTTGTTADVIFDVTGYYVQDTSGATYMPVTPNRLVDSRGGAIGLSGSLRAKVPAEFAVTGQSADPNKNIPSSAVAVDVNLTAANEGSIGYLSLTPDLPDGVPSTSTLNFPARDIRANALTISLRSGGTLWVTFVGPTGSKADAVVDVMGYFTME